MKESNIKLLKILWRFIPWLVVLFFIAIAVILGGKVDNKKSDVEEQRKNGTTNGKPAINVVIQKIEPETITDRINLPAIIKPWEDLMVTAEVDGLVTELFVKEGDWLKKGDPICKIEDKDYTNNLDNIRAAYELAKLNFERFEKLKASNDISKAEFDERKARLDQLAASLEDAKLDLDRCTIKTHISGVINTLPAKIGLLLNRGDPAAQIVDISTLKVDVGIPESDIYSVQNIDKCTMTIEALDDKIVTGKKIFLSVQPGSIARLYTLRLKISNPDGSILPGMFCRVDVVKQVYEDAVVVPLYSIITRDQEKFVFIEREEKGERHEVELGVIEGWNVQITKGISIGDNLIIVGHRNLDDGQPLNVLKVVRNASEIYQ